MTVEEVLTRAADLLEDGLVGRSHCPSTAITSAAFKAGEPDLAHEAHRRLLETLELPAPTERLEAMHAVWMWYDEVTGKSRPVGVAALRQAAEGT